MAAIFFLIFVDFIWINFRKIYREKKEKSNFGNLLPGAYPNPWLENVSISMKEGWFNKLFGSDSP